MRPLPRTAAGRSPLGSPPASRRAGAALMVSLLVLFVLVAVVFQISIATGTDARVTRNVVNTTSMELAVESALLKFMDELAQDAEQGASGGGGGVGGPATAGSGLPGLPGGPGGAGGGGADTDSQMDDWARPRPTTINGIEVLFWAQDEDGKYNVLAMLTKDPEEADKAEERVERILDYCREGTLWDIDNAQAADMARVMRELMEQRRDAALPRPRLLTDDEDNEDRGLPLTLREFVALPEFVENRPNHQGRYFEDFRDEEGTVVHSLASFLTMSSSVATYDDYRSQLQAEASAGEEGGGDPTTLNQAGGQAPEGDLPPGSEGTAERPVDQAQGITQVGGQADGASGLPGQGPTNGVAGVAVNLNTAPRAVLEGLFDDRDVEREFWFRVLEYRNEELEDENDDEEPLLDEFGEEIVERQTFQSIGDIGQIDGWDHLEPLVQAEVQQLVTVKSNTFSLFLVAHRRTGGESGEFGLDKDALREEREQDDALTVAVRCIVWRRQANDGWEVVPLERWERLGYEPIPVQDFPDEDR